MEAHEIQHITANLSKLIENTSCNTLLLVAFKEQNLLSRADLETLEVTSRNEGTLSQSRKFYEIIQTRKGAYSVLLEVLKDTNQSGAASILESITPEPSSKKRKTRNYKKAPAFVEKFLAANCTSATLIISTPDCDITTTRIIETVPNTRLSSFSDLVDNLSQPEHSSESFNFTPVVNCESDLSYIKDTLAVQPKKIFVTGVNNLDEIKSNFPDIDTRCVRFESDSLEWNDLSLSLQVKLRETIKQVLPDFQPNDADLKNAVLFDLIKGRKPTLFKNTIPEPLRYYVPRKIITRNVISERVFLNEGPDIFLIKGVEQHELSELARGDTTDISSNIIQHAAMATKLALLEHDEHFDIIAEKLQHRPVHMLTKENGKFLWLRSSGGIHTIQQSLHSDQLFIQEADFLQNVLCSYSLSNDLIFVSETPGMGKSVLLGQFGRDILRIEKDLTTQGSVAFVVISELVKETKRFAAKSNLSERVFLALANAVCENDLGIAFLRKNKSNLKNLLLDGLDELVSEDVEISFQILTIIRELFPGTRVWVTTRPHMFDQLEKTFNVLGYNIEPFDEKDQVQFLDSYWSSSLPGIVDQTKLSTFAKDCLNMLKSTIKTEYTEDIAGVPLQCLLIAEVFEEDARRYCDTTNFQASVRTVKSLTDLYEKMVRKKFDIFYQKYDKDDLNYGQLLQAHVYLSIMLLFPNFVEKLGNELRLPDMRVQQIFNVGILESKSSLPAPRFIHRTFAEFFVAKFIVESLTFSMSMSRFELLLQIFRTSAIVCSMSIVSDFRPILQEYEDFQKPNLDLKSQQFNHRIICYFINAQLEQNKTYTFSNYLTIELLDLANILHACVNNNFESIFLRLLCHLENFQRNIVSLMTPELMMLGVATAGRSTVTQLFKFFNAVNSTPLTKIRTQGYSLLHITAICGNYSAFEFLLGNDAIKDSIVSTKEDFMDILYHCVENSMSQSEKVVNQKCEIVKRLMKLGFKLENFQVNKLLLIYRSSVNIKLLVLIIQPVLSAKDEHLIQQILHQSTDVYNCREYQQLVQYVKSTNGPECVTKFMNESFKGKHLIHSILWRMKCDVTMLQFLRDNGLNFASYKNDLQGFFESVVRQNVKCLEWLLTNCADLINETPTYFWLSYDENNYTHCWFLLDKKLVDPTSLNKANESWFKRLIKNKSKVTVEMCQLAQHFVKNGVDIGTVQEDSNSALPLFFKTNPTQHALQFLKIFQISWNSTVFVLEKLKWIIQLGCIGESELDRPLSGFIKENGVNGVVDSQGNTLLHLAAEKCNHDALTYFLRLGASVNTKNTEGGTALHKLPKHDSDFSMECWKTLIDHDADPTILDNNNFTPIGTSWVPIKLLAVQYAIKHFQSIVFPKTTSIFLLACSALSLQRTKDLCEWYTGYIKTPIKDIRGDFKGEHLTLLDVVFRRYDGDFLKYFMQELGCTEMTKSIDTLIYDDEFEFKRYPDRAFKFVEIINNTHPSVFNRPNKYGFYPLSVKGIHWHYVELLVSVGADVNCTDSDGNTPLHWALKHDYWLVDHLVKSLINAGADVNAVTFKGETPLFLAITLSDSDDIKECVKLLMGSKADATKNDTFGNTFLHLLPSKLDKSVFFCIVEDLLKIGQSELLQIPDENGLTSIQVAKQHYCIDSELSKLLSEYGISI